MKVRLIGIDTPETVHPTKPVECFGKEAKEKMLELLDGNQIYFGFDETQSDTDRYGRALLYIWRAEDNLFINEYLVSEGYAELYETTPPFLYRDRFYKLEQNARQSKKGLWGSTCTYSNDV